MYNLERHSGSVGDMIIQALLYTIEGYGHVKAKPWAAAEYPANPMQLSELFDAQAIQQ